MPWKRVVPDETVKPGSPLPWVGELKRHMASSKIADEHDNPIAACWTQEIADAVITTCNAYPGLVARVAALEAELAQEKQDHADDVDALASVRAERDRLRKALGLLTTDDVAEWLEANKHARAALAPKEPS